MAKLKYSGRAFAIYFRKRKSKQSWTLLSFSPRNAKKGDYDINGRWVGPRSYIGNQKAVLVRAMDDVAKKHKGMEFVAILATGTWEMILPGNTAFPKSAIRRP